MDNTQAQGGGARSAPKAVVLPGEEISLNGLAAGSGMYTEGGRTFASLVGLRIEHRGMVSVVPLSGVYNPRQGDTIIGHVLDTGPSIWTLDIRASQPTNLHVNDVPWKVDFGDTAKYIDVGESVLCRVLKVDELKRVFITLAGPGLRKLEGGQVIEIPHTKINRVVGKQAATVEKLRKWTSCRIYPAANGRIWIDGDAADMKVAVAAIELIAAEADEPDLSAKLDAFLRKHGREPKAAPEGQAGFGTDEGGAKKGGSDEADDEAETKRREARAEEE